VRRLARPWPIAVSRTTGTSAIVGVGADEGVVATPSSSGHLHVEEDDVEGLADARSVGEEVDSLAAAGDEGGAPVAGFEHLHQDEAVAIERISRRLAAH